MHTMPVVAVHCKQYHLKINKNIFSQRVYEYLTKPNQYQFRAHRNRFSNDFYLIDIVRFSHMTTENLKRKPTQTKQNSCLKQTLLTLYTQTGQRSMVTNCKQHTVFLDSKRSHQANSLSPEKLARMAAKAELDLQRRDPNGLNAHLGVCNFMFYF